MAMVAASTLQDRKTFLVKERIGFLKLTDAFDIYDPTSGAQIGIAREKVSFPIKIARLLINKRLMPTTLEVRDHDEAPLAMSLRRGVAFFHAHVSVRDALGQEIGRFKSKLFSIAGGFNVFDPHGRQVAEIKGDWKGWNFRFLSADGLELGKVTKKWAGIGKEFFTSADNYMIALDEQRQLPRESAMLLLAAGLAIDSVYKEK